MIDLLSDVALASFLLALGLSGYALRVNPRKMETVCFAAGMAVFAFISLARFMEYHAAEPGLWRSLAYAGRVVLPAAWLLFSVIFARSDSSGHLARWRAAIGATWVVSAALLGAFAWTSLRGDARSLETVEYWTSIFLVIAFTAILANFESTLRSGEHRQRWRIKFLVIGLGSIFVFKLVNLAYVLVFPLAEHDFSLVVPSVILAGSGVAAFSFFRHSLLDVGVAVSRDVVRNSIIVALVGASLVLVGIIAAAIRTFGGDFGFYLVGLFVFLALVFLALVLLSTHVRKTVRMFIDRHFFRSKYDYRKEWLRLTGRLSAKLEARELAASLARAFSEIFWIDRMHLWLFEDRDGGLRLIFPGDDAAGDAVRWDPVLVRCVTGDDRPVLPAALREAAGLPDAARQQAALLDERGIAVLVPLALESQPIGIIGLPASRYGASFDSEDLALIHTIARQAASSFRSAQLAESIVRSKELETFHLFSTFVIHDLKNFVSMLSLVARNMETNINNPEFQRDARETIARTADKMKRMMARLSALSGAPALARMRTDVNALVADVVDEMRAAVRARLTTEYGKLPPVDLDPGQMKNVLRNLVKNADEAAAKEGDIRVSTVLRDGAVAIAVADNGCGIPREYMQKDLFRLFATTKSDGFGIGLFQARRIVELHGGRIEVESEVGKGSTFRICLPAESE